MAADRKQWESWQTDRGLTEGGTVNCTASGVAADTPATPPSHPVTPLRWENQTSDTMRRTLSSSPPPLPFFGGCDRQAIS